MFSKKPKTAKKMQFYFDFKGILKTGQIIWGARGYRVPITDEDAADLLGGYISRPLKKGGRFYAANYTPGIGCQIAKMPESPIDIAPECLSETALLIVEQVLSDLGAGKAASFKVGEPGYYNSPVMVDPDLISSALTFRRVHIEPAED